MSSSKHTSPMAIEDISKVFETVLEFRSDFQDEQINVKCRWVQSKRSGLNVIFAKAQSDCVFGTFTFLTDATGPKPLAACVQRLTSCGSENFPANFVERIGREISMGYAGTFLLPDRSVYTVNAQNDRGLIAMLPPYLDSIFLPLLTQEDFESQIYKPKGNKGRPAGAMYKELLAGEHRDKFGLRDLESHIYPESCVYHYSVQGRLDTLPTITLDEVRAYHAAYYRPSNCFVILAGNIDSSDILQVLNSFEIQLPRELLRRSVAMGPKLAVPSSKPALLQPDISQMLEIARASNNAAKQLHESIKTPLGGVVRFTSEVETIERHKLQAQTMANAPGVAPERMFTVHVIMQGPDLMCHEEWTAFQLIARLLKQTLSGELLAGDLDPMDLDVGSRLTSNSDSRRWPLTTLTWRSVRESKLENMKFQYQELVQRLLTPGDPVSVADAIGVSSLLDNAVDDYRDQLSWRAEYDIVKSLTCWISSCSLERPGAVESFHAAVHPAVAIRRLRTKPIEWWTEFVKKNFAHGVYIIERSRFSLDTDAAGFDSLRRSSRWTLSSAGSDRGIPKDVKQLRECDWQHRKDHAVEEYFQAIGFQDASHVLMDESNGDRPAVRC